MGVIIYNVILNIHIKELWEELVNMKKTILAKIQLVHSYVTNFSISINDKIENEHQVELEGQVEFKFLI